jgi:hypothetical protein
MEEVWDPRSSQRRIVGGPQLHCQKIVKFLRAFMQCDKCMRPAFSHVRLKPDSLHFSFGKFLPGFLTVYVVMSG